MQSDSNRVSGRPTWRNLHRAWLVLTLVLGVAILGDLAGAQAQSIGGPCTQTDGPTRALGLFKPGKPVSLEEGFRDPPPISRAQCWWQCLGSAWTKEEITREIEEFKVKGMGGVTIKDTLPMPRDAKTEHIKDVPYMSPEWLDLFAHVVAECGRLGLICRSRLGSGWNEGGPWVTPEMSSQELAFVQSKPIVGPSKYTGPIPSAGELPANKDLAAGEAFVVAVRQGEVQRIDLTAHVGADRRLAWDVPEGTWTLVSCYSEPSRVGNVSTSKAGAGRHHDHLSTAAADLHLENVAGKMLARLRTFDNTAFDGFNSDSWELGTPTWTPGFRHAFFKRCGYDPAPFLPVLRSVQWKTKNHVHGSAELAKGLRDEDLRFLYDFRTTVSDLIVEKFYRHVSRWCQEHHVVLEAQAGGPMYVPRDPIQAHGVVDIPMGEFWGSGWDCVKLATSAAHAYGRRLASLESLTNTTMGPQKNHISTPPAEMKQRIDNAFILGGNYLTMAVVEYSPAEAGLPGWVHNCGPHLNHCQTWWPLARAFYDYLGRCCFLLQSGRPVAQVAIYHTFRTAEDFRWLEPGERLTSFPKEFSFDYVNDDLIERHMSVRDGRIVLDSGATYEVLCIEPTPAPTMPLATLRKIRDLVRQGATVVWLAKPPAHAPGLIDYPRCDVEFQAILRDLEDSGQFKHMPAGYAGLVPIVQAGRNPPAWQTASESPLRVVHRRTPTAEVFFLANPGPTVADAPVMFRVTGRPAEIWDPDTGLIRPIAGQTLPEGVSLAAVCARRGQHVRRLPRGRLEG